MSHDSPSNATDAVNTLRWELGERVTEPITQALELQSEEQARARILAALIVAGHLGPFPWDASQVERPEDRRAAHVRRESDPLRLRDLHPEASSAMTDMSMDCPKCGRRLWLALTQGEPVAGRWRVSGFDGAHFADKLTLTPSIQGPWHGVNGKPVQCGVHFSIINGEIVP